MANMLHYSRFWRRSTSPAWQSISMNLVAFCRGGQKFVVIVVVAVVVFVCLFVCLSLG